MGLQDVKELVSALEGMPAGYPLDTHASRLTIGDLRLLLHCAYAVVGEPRELRAADTIGAQPLRAGGRPARAALEKG